MGEIADDIINGLMCELCGVWMPEVSKWLDEATESLDEDGVDDPFDNPPGHPRRCEDCKRYISNCAI